MPNYNNNECKIILVGDSKAGKTALVSRLIGSRFTDSIDAYEKITANSKAISEGDERLFENQNLLKKLIFSKKTLIFRAKNSFR